MAVTIKPGLFGGSGADLRNVLVREISDHSVPLTETGREQAREAGRVIGADSVRGARLCLRSSQSRSAA